ncbi:MAG: hypothetical protein ACT4QG_21050 [Sporichthyaceae bacterium]
MTQLDDQRAAFFGTWRRLWATEKSMAGNEAPDSAFAPIGLFVEPPDRPGEWDYDATPAGALTFASTGGDGVHFSFVETPGRSVIVMTVPMVWDRPNVVVGATLFEFLSLGCRFGYFALEQLAYDRDGTVDAIRRAAEEGDQPLLGDLRTKLGLTPWTSVRARLDELATMTPSPRRVD